jgi:hypothetical protein
MDGSKDDASMDQHKVNMRLSIDRALLTVRSPNNLKYVGIGIYVF